MQSLQQVLEERAQRRLELLKFAYASRPQGAIYEIVVEGAGEQVHKEVRRALLALIADGCGPIHVRYTGLSEPVWDPPLARWEEFVDKSADSGALNAMQPDLVLVATPPHSHCNLAERWLTRARVVLIEKPLDETMAPINSMLHKFVLISEEVRRQGQPRPDVWLPVVVGLDHYVSCAAAFREFAPQIERHLATGIASADVVIEESAAISIDRLPTLRAGITADLWPHALGLSSLFTDVLSATDITLKASGRYRPMIATDGTNIRRRFRYETFSEVHHRALLLTDQTQITVRARMGKGMPADVKYLELSDATGEHSCRIDFIRDEGDVADSPNRKMMLLCSREKCSCSGLWRDWPTLGGDSKQARWVNGQGDAPRLDKLAYRRLFESLIRTTPGPLAETIGPLQAQRVVELIDVVRGQLGNGPWPKYPLTRAS